MAGEVDYIAIYTISDYDGRGEIPIDCQTMSGGHPQPALGKSRNPRTGLQSSRGGQVDMADLEIEAEIDLALWNKKARIDGAAGRVRYTATKVFVDSLRQPTGDTETFTGYVGEPDWGNFDINAGDNNSMLKITSGVDQPKPPAHA